MWLQIWLHLQLHVPTTTWAPAALLLESNDEILLHTSEIMPPGAHRSKYQKPRMHKLDAIFKLE